MAPMVIAFNLSLPSIKPVVTEEEAINAQCHIITFKVVLDKLLAVAYLNIQQAQ